MSDINMEDIERNSPVVIPPTQEQQQQIPTISRSTDESAGGGGQATKNRLKALLTLRIPQPVEAAPSNNNNFKRFLPKAIQLRDKIKVHKSFQ